VRKNMDIIRKDGQIIFSSKTGLPLQGVLVFVAIGIMAMSAPIQMIGSFISSMNTLEISCNKKAETQLVDCQISTIPLLGIFPATTETYKGIKKVEYQVEHQEDSDGDIYTLYYVLFYQTSETKKIKFDERGSWVASQINEFINSSQETLRLQQSKSIEPAQIALIIIVSIVSFPFGLVFLRVGLFHYSVNINSNLRQIVITNFIIPLYTKTFSFSDIKGLGLIESWDEGDKRYSIEIHTTKNEKIYLWSTYNENEANNLVNEIRRITGFYVIEQRLPPTQDS